MNFKKCAALILVGEDRLSEPRDMNQELHSGIRKEGRLIYTLLDAVEEEGRLDPATGAQWRAIRARIRRTEDYEVEAESLLAALGALQAGGALRGTWIEQRCAQLEARLRCDRTAWVD